MPFYEAYYAVLFGKASSIIKLEGAFCFNISEAKKLFLRKFNFLKADY
jgi:hypothetical protein